MMNRAVGAPPLVCIVDDDRCVREALDGLLRSSGLATSMHGSLDEFRAADSVAASCLVLDVNLPGTTGLDFLLTMAADDLAIPVVLITGFCDGPLAMRAIQARAIDILPKPFNDTDLLEAVEAGITVDRARRARRNQSGVKSDIARL